MTSKSDPASPNAAADVVARRGGKLTSPPRCSRLPLSSRTRSAEGSRWKRDWPLQRGKRVFQTCRDKRGLFIFVLFAFTLRLLLIRARREKVKFPPEFLLCEGAHGKECAAKQRAVWNNLFTVIHWRAQKTYRYHKQFLVYDRKKIEKGHPSVIMTYSDSSFWLCSSFGLWDYVGFPTTKVYAVRPEVMVLKGAMKTK